MNAQKYKRLLLDRISNRKAAIVEAVCIGLSHEQYLLHVGMLRIVDDIVRDIEDVSDDAEEESRRLFHEN